MTEFSHARIATDGQPLSAEIEALKRVSCARAFQQKVNDARADRAQCTRLLTEIDPETRRAAQAFLDRIEGQYAVVEAIVYGSRARGDHRPDSDADLAIILEGKGGDRYTVAGDFAGIEFHIMMETGIMVQGLPIWQDELAHPETFKNPALIANILREGIPLRAAGLRRLRISPRPKSIFPRRGSCSALVSRMARAAEPIMRCSMPPMRRSFRSASRA